MKEGDCEYLFGCGAGLTDKKPWFGVSKFCSTTALREAIWWKRASEVVFCHLRYGVRMGSFVVGEEDTQSIPFAKDHAVWACGLATGCTIIMWCEPGQCYFVCEECACKLCACSGG